MQKKALIIFKYPHAWNTPVINKFSNYYETEYLYISDFKNLNFEEIVKKINDFISLKKIEITIFDVDYFKFLNFFFIEKVQTKVKILITGDDFHLHDMHSITASACDIVLSHCPLSVLKYKEKGFKSHLFHMEFSVLNKDLEINKYKNNNKEIDVLFFGHITPDRKNILNYITDSGIKLKNVGHENQITGLPKDELLEIISKSKIIINLSKSRTSSVHNYNKENIYKFYYQFKGRVILAGLMQSACVSEYSPGQELLFNKDELFSFYTKEECVDILKKLIKDNKLLEDYTKKFTSKVHALCQDEKNFEPILNEIENTSNQKIKLIKIPYWYLRISAKQIILRNIKLSNIFKTIFQLGVIYKMVSKSNFFIKILIFIETLLNILWYSIIRTFKIKK